METIYSDNNIDILIEVDDEIKNGVFIHTNVKEFSLSTYKKFKQIWKDCQKALKLRGFKFVLALPPGEKEEKWEKMFGFEYTNIHINKLRLMRMYL